MVEKLELVRYLGGQFPNGPAFHTLANAQEFLRVVKESGWDGGGIETRIVLHEWHESIRVTPSECDDNSELLALVRQYRTAPETVMGRDVDTVLSKYKGINLT